VTNENISANTIINTNINSTLSVTGIASTKVKPDKVIVSLGIETTNKTANTALAANSEIMNKILVSLKDEGVKENETSTSFFNISPIYNNNYSETSIERNIAEYIVTNSIQIEL
jgi:uncharacterized protein